MHRVDNVASERKYNILVVDDNEANRLAMETTLAPLQENVVLVSSGEEALRALLRQEFDVVLMDVNMPGMDGLETAAAIRENEKFAHLPIIFVTATDYMGQYMADGYAVGAVDYVYTPVIPAILRAKVRALLSLRRHAERVRELEQREHQRAIEATREKLAAEERRNRSLAQSVDLLAIAGTDGYLKRLNPRWEAALGFSKEELTARPLVEFIHAEDRPAAVEIIHRLAAGEPVTGVEMRFGSKSGGYRWLAVNATPFLEEDLIYFAAHDTTERRQAEARLVQAQKMESIGRLAGGIAHDFNNLLTVINGYSHLLLGRLRPGDPLRAGLEAILKAGERAAGLTQQLLAFSRKQVLELRVLDLNQVVGEMRPMLERLVGEDVEVRVALHAQVGTVRADPHQLEQVVMNLVVNARDAMPDGGKLLLETACVEWGESYVTSHPEARAGRYVMLAVSDSGMGMDEETQRHIFEPFFTTKGVGKGTGLGLSMVQGIVTQSGGSIEVYSEIGHGTTFKIYLPRVEEAVVEAALPEAVAVLGGTETVLVVEDQAEVRDYAATTLKAYGYRVIKAENAGEALLLYERERIDLLLTDVVMPNISGRELAGRLGKMQPGIKVLFMSGYTDNVVAHHGVLEKGVAFIQKPFSPERLALRVRQVLAGVRQEGL
jgi:PAS domain S-box-containing protein